MKQFYVEVLCDAIQRNIELNQSSPHSDCPRAIEIEMKMKMKLNRTITSRKKKDLSLFYNKRKKT